MWDVEIVEPAFPERRDVGRPNVGLKKKLDPLRARLYPGIGLSLTHHNTATMSRPRQRRCHRCRQERFAGTQLSEPRTGGNHAAALARGSAVGKGAVVVVVVPAGARVVVVVVTGPGVLVARAAAL